MSRRRACEGKFPKRPFGMANGYRKDLCRQNRRTCTPISTRVVCMQTDSVCPTIIIHVLQHAGPNAQGPHQGLSGKLGSEYAQTSTCAAISVTYADTNTMARLAKMTLWLAEVHKHRIAACHANLDTRPFEPKRRRNSGCL